MWCISRRSEKFVQYNLSGTQHKSCAMQLMLNTRDGLKHIHAIDNKNIFKGVSWLLVFLQK